MVDVAKTVRACGIKISAKLAEEEYNARKKPLATQPLQLLHVKGYNVFAYDEAKVKAWLASEYVSFYMVTNHELNWKRFDNLCKLDEAQQVRLLTGKEIHPDFDCYPMTREGKLLAPPVVALYVVVDESKFAPGEDIPTLLDLATAGFKRKTVVPPSSDASKEQPATSQEPEEPAAKKVRVAEGEPVPEQDDVSKTDTNEPSHETESMENA
jgi:hypothetical protein